MEKINQFLNKYLMYVFYAMLVFAISGNFRSCGTSKEVTKLRKDVDSLTTTVNALIKQSYDKEDLNTRISIEGYEISKRMLYDQNAIVRTTVRPDDRMNEYDMKIKELREKLK